MRTPVRHLIDLFASVSAEELCQLSPTRRLAVEFALRRTDTVVSDVDTLAVCLGVLDLLRAVAAKRTTLLLLDDFHWMDPASAEVLAFVARRLARPRYVCSPRSAPRRRGRPGRVGSPGSVRLEVGPLAGQRLASAVVIVRAGSSAGRGGSDLRCRGGNPLFALEIADAVRRGGVRPTVGQPLPVPVHLDVLIRQRLAALTESARDTVRLAAAASRPTWSNSPQAGCEHAELDLAAASEAGICDLSAGGTIQFDHPLIRAAVYAEAPVIVRMGLHAKLAAVVADPIERARHLALATVVEDETVAAALTTAAELARRRGAPAAARELAGLAAQRTPPADVSAWAQRRLSEASYAYAAGQATRRRRPPRRCSPPMAYRGGCGPGRRLMVLEACGNAIGMFGEQVQAALADAEGDPELEPWARMHSASHHLIVGRNEAALVEAQRAADGAAAGGDARAELRSVYLILAINRRLGVNVEEVTSRALHLAESHSDLGDAAYLIFLELANRCARWIETPRPATCCTGIEGG